MVANSFWNHQNEDDRKRFVLLMAPLVAASRTKSFTRYEAIAYMTSMQDTPEAILQEAVQNLLAAGVTWMPRPGDLKTECAKVMATKRQLAYQKSLPGVCPICGREKDFTGARFKEVSINGVTRMVKCDCVRAALEAANNVGLAIALPPANPSDSDGV